MGRITGWVAGLVVATVVAACGDSASSSGGVSYAGPTYGDSCAAYTTCGSCTPVVGCGWCFNNAGGQCASSPDECAYSNSEFTWTWESAGCPTVDASVGPPVGQQAQDAGAPEASAPTPEASAPEAAVEPEAGSEASAPAGDAGSGDAAEEP
jgi:hypothetical protein